MADLDPDILHALQRISAQLDALPSAITAAIMTDLLERVDEPAAEPGCQHPADKRIDLGDGEWQCGVRACRFHYVEPVAVMP